MLELSIDRTFSVNWIMNGEKGVNWGVLGFCFHFYFKFDGCVYICR